MEDDTKNNNPWSETIESILLEYGEIHQKHTEAVFELVKKVYKLGFKDGAESLHDESEKTLNDIKEGMK